MNDFDKDNNIGRDNDLNINNDINDSTDSGRDSGKKDFGTSDNYSSGYKVGENGEYSYVYRPKNEEPKRKKKGKAKYVVISVCAVILCFALTVQCALDPAVITSASFQLSYLAMCGIYFLYPALRDMYPAPVPVLKKIWDSAAMSIACQVFTGPLAWLLFGSAPVYFIITNLIAIPLTSALMPAALAAVFLYRIGICPGFMIRAIDMTAELVVDCLEIICRLP